MNQDCLGAIPSFGLDYFKRIFRVSRFSYDAIPNYLCSNVSFFQEGFDVTHHRRVSSDAKILISLKYFAYGCSINFFFMITFKLENLRQYFVTLNGDNGYILFICNTNSDDTPLFWIFRSWIICHGVQWTSENSSLPCRKLQGPQIGLPQTLPITSMTNNLLFVRWRHRWFTCYYTPRTMHWHEH